MIRLCSLKKRSEFLELKEQEAFFCKYFILQTKLSPESDTLFFGIVASKKIGNAVFRNRAKRRMRSLFRDLIKLNPDIKGARVVMIARRQLLDETYSVLLTELIRGVGSKGALK